MRFAMTARTVARIQEEGGEVNDLTARNIDKVTRYRKNGEDELESMVAKIKALEFGDRSQPIYPKRVYHKPPATQTVM